MSQFGFKIQTKLSPYTNFNLVVLQTKQLLFFFEAWIIRRRWGEDVARMHVSSIEFAWRKFYTGEVVRAVKRRGVPAPRIKTKRLTFDHHYQTTKYIDKVAFQMFKSFPLINHTCFIKSLLFLRNLVNNFINNASNITTFKNNTLIKCSV